MSLLQSVAFFTLGIAFSFLPSHFLPSFGAALPSATAAFETSLQAPITSSATSMTLTANSIRGGGALSGFNCFTVDEGSAQAETICGTVSGTSVTSLTRGISQSTGTTTVAALQFAHRRGANVKITDFPLVQILKAQLNGEDTIPNTLSLDSIAKYTSAPTFTQGSNQLVSALYAESYANNVISGGAPTSTETVGGKVLLATQLHMASSTYQGVTAPEVLQSRYATSSPGSAGLWTVITNNAGKIAQAFLDLTQDYIWTGLHTFSQRPVGATSFGGNGADGAFAPSGTTTINAGSAAYVIKNYSSINISAGNGLAFSTPNASGTIAILRSRGDCTIAGVIDASGMGGAGGTSITGGTPAPYGQSGATSLPVFYTGTGTGGNSSGGAAGATSSPASAVAGVAAGASPAQVFANSLIGGKTVPLINGGGGGAGGSSGGNEASGAGGRGGGSILLECAGTLNFTGAILARGQSVSVGASGATYGAGGGGGGAGGTVVVIANAFGSTSGQFGISGGTGGTGGMSGSAGGAGGNGTGGTGSGGSGAAGAYVFGGGGGAGGMYLFGTANGSSAGNPPANGGGGGGGGGASGYATSTLNLMF